MCEALCFLTHSYSSFLPSHALLPLCIVLTDLTQALASVLQTQELGLVWHCRLDFHLGLPQLMLESQLFYFQ